MTGDKDHFELLLKNVIEDLCIKEYKEDLSCKIHRFSFSFKYKMHKLLKKEKTEDCTGHTTSYVWKHKFVFVLILILIMTFAISCSPVRKAIQKIMYYLFEDHIEMQIEDEFGDFQEESLLEIPGGFSKIYENISEENSTYDIVYENREGENIFYSQSSGVNQTSITWNEADMEVISDDLLYISDGEINTVILKRGSYTYSVSASLDKSMLLEIIENLRN